MSCFTLKNMKRGKATVNTSISLEGRICCCKRSACRKKYCECYRLNKLCTAACKCVGCCNKEMIFGEDAAGPSFMNLTLDAPIAAALESSITAPATSPPPVFVPPLRLKAAPKKEPKKKVVKEPITKNPPILIQKPQVPITVNCISTEVVDSVIKCLLAQAQECVDCRLNEWQTERMILDTFDGCLVDILRCMGIQASADENLLAPLPAEATETTNRTSDNAPNNVEYTDLVESTTLDLAALSTTEDNSSTMYVFENEDVKNIRSNEDSETLPESVKPEPLEATAAAAVSNLQYSIDAVDNGNFDFDSFSQICNENAELLDLGNVNEAIQFVENQQNLDDNFEFSDI